MDFASAPFVVIWEVTRACALACVHCRAEAIPLRHPEELTTEEGFALVDRVAAFGPRRPLVVLTGGDPLRRRDAAELVRYGVASAPATTPPPATRSPKTPAAPTSRSPRPWPDGGGASHVGVTPLWEVVTLRPDFRHASPCGSERARTAGTCADSRRSVTTP